MNSKYGQVSDLTVYIFILIVLVAIMYSFKDWKPPVIALAVIGVVMYNRASEHLESTVPVTNTTVLKDTMNINLDDDSFSEYKNISLARDIDSMEQRQTNLDLPADPNQPIDNSDVVESASFKFSSNYQPNNSPVQYTVPLNDVAYDLDESLTRGQQHRASINKRAIDGAVRSTKNVFQKVFTKELNENSEREWWSAESTDFETDYHPYY